MTQRRRTKAELIAEVGLAFRREQNRGQAFDELVAERLGIGLTDLRCIDIIEQHGGLTAGELAAAAHLSTGAVTGVLDRLERAGYARRVADEADRRRVRVELTDRARRAAGEIFAPVGEAFNGVFERYTVDELGLVLDLLRRCHSVGTRLLADLESDRR